MPLQCIVRALYASFFALMNRSSKIALLMGSMLFLSACGQRGPLYLPKDAPSNKPESESHSDAPATNVMQEQ
jgi:predicted small lipoprotein YifL